MYISILKSQTHRLNAGDRHLDRTLATVGKHLRLLVESAMVDDTFQDLMA